MQRRPTHKSTFKRRGRRRTNRKRRGAALVEAVLTIGVILTMTLGLIDFGLMVLKHNILSQASRQLARQAIVHGDLAVQGSWGPSTVTVNAADTGPIGTIVRNNLILYDPNDVTIQVDWIDSGNSVQLHDRVQVTLTAPTQPWLTFMFGNPTYSTIATSTMPIAH